MLSNLPWILAVIAIGALAAVLAWRLRAPRPAAGPAPLPVDWDLLPRPVFTADERRMYRQLREALPHHVILAKLPLVRFCQPADPEKVRDWYELLGAIQVSFAVCSLNGRVLAAIDLHYDRGGPPARATRIKQSALGACRVRYLRCPADHLPSVAELQLLVPQSASANRGPQPAQAAESGQAGALPAAGAASGSRRRERTALWQDSLPFTDSFFMPERRFEAAGLCESEPEVEGVEPGHAAATLAPTPTPTPTQPGAATPSPPTLSLVQADPDPAFATESTGPAPLTAPAPATGTYGGARALTS
ncbi:DUF2726 domain-containing protein [Aquabacterium sp. OR-4]|uniref:DUF2726 domain-containing protein n=1 Tax=Aquabacterium sp. OR-4 TaxID=2978127 RepID=UPI0021B4BA4E|nr:DUF2726 domain-containing protein [Aquabacterium sp. OR-4]MDT7837630.1 DUF2726 domain-containing protein [Aquabacterium sp. OR-4]